MRTELIRIGNSRGVRILKPLRAEHELVSTIRFHNPFAPAHVDNKMSGPFRDVHVGTAISFKAFQVNYQIIRARKFSGWIYRWNGRV